MAKSNAKSKAKSKRGGARPNAGRKASPAKALRSEAVAVERDTLAEVEDLLRGLAPRCLANLVKLANGGFEQVEEKWLCPPSTGGMVPDEPQLAERRVSVAAPDRVANIYLLDRVLGKPRQAVEVTGKDGGPIPIEIYLPDNGRDTRGEGEGGPAPAQLPAPGAVPQHPG